MVSETLPASLHSLDLQQPAETDSWLEDLVEGLSDLILRASLCRREIYLIA